MSPDRISGLSGTPQPKPPAESGQTPAASAPTSDFGATLRLQVATLKTQSLEVLIGSIKGTEASPVATAIDTLGSARLNAPGLPASIPTIPGLSATGRIPSLRDPEAAYRMMSVINQAEATYTAQHSELKQMREMLADLGKAATDLLGTTDQSNVNPDALTGSFNRFSATYNAWVGRFSDAFSPGGVLHGNQAGQVVRSELRNIIGDIFTGAAHGFQGLSDLGLSIEDNGQTAVFDAKTFKQIVLENPTGVRETVRQFATHFEKATELLASNGNFIDNRLGNLQRALDFISSNKPSLQAEFGLGDPAQPVTAVASTHSALASYIKTAGI